MNVTGYCLGYIQQKMTEGFVFFNEQYLNLHIRTNNKYSHHEKIVQSCYIWEKGNNYNLYVFLFNGYLFR